MYHFPKIACEVHRGAHPESIVEEGGQILAKRSDDRMLEIDLQY